MRSAHAWAPLAVAAAILFGPVAARAQGTAPTSEALPAVRDAEARVAAGDLEGAEALLVQILERQPGALNALFELERVLRMSGGLDRLVPRIERLIEVDSVTAIGHQMLVRTYSALDKPELVESAAEDWIRRAPGTETPYREVARVWEERGDFLRAASVLERGREDLRRPTALALELGDLHARLGNVSRAVAEWTVAMGPDGRGLILVRRRLSGLPDGGAAVLPGLVDALVQGATSVGQRRAAANLAVAAGLEAKALQIAEGVASELAGPEREAFLVEMARGSDGTGMPRLGHWAYKELVALEEDPSSKLALRSRLAELALVVGDTLAARESFAELERNAAMGSEERRKATAMRVQLTAREGRLDDAMQEIEAFQREFPDAPELDEVVAAVAGVALESGELERVESLLAGSRGPRTSLARAHLALRRSDLAEARSAFVAAAGQLRGEEATRAIAMATLLGRLSPEGGEIVGRAMEAMARKESGEALTWLVDQSAALPAPERAAILDFAAELADRAQLTVEAETIRRTIVESYPKSNEAPEALLALARSLLRQEETREEARELLERLILEYPRSALVPQARGELDRLRRRASS